MTNWDRLGGSTYIGVMTRHEIDVLDSYVVGLLGLLSHRAESYLPVGGTRARMPAAPTKDDRIKAILVAELGADEPDWFLALNEECVLREVAEALQLMASTLPASGGVVMLRVGAEPAAWLRCIRHVLAIIAAVVDHNGEVRDQASEPTVIWLNALADGLTTASAHVALEIREHGR
ncbi:hypothetical protein [Lentzea sp. NBRC 102530]|uniref:DUF2017 family protein n=1 Tax=Lentzea sp. NBRC 102530 TaxID=3032201 RepID=UPI0024A53ED7|nr:hypothetical protein [Lentzea sp. NBRC 102530]MDX3663054.1 hypothetical protein [Streptomyces sp. ID05-26A]GLY55240.1 hypothetical protein Lesp01_88950 [Lentzea sp. NBRC 102530]